MAMFGLDVKTISRLNGGSVVKSAAYILRDNIYDHYLDKTHYYSHVKDLVYSKILVPYYAPRAFRDRDTLLAAIDQAESRYDARTGRMIRLSLPNDRGITDEDRIKLATRFVREEFVRLGMCAILAIHEGKNEIPEKCNPHAHVIITDRPVCVTGFEAKKDRSWNRVQLLCKWRERWAEMQNQLYKEKELDLSVSHESLQVQGINREPTVPLGRAAMALERKGIHTEPGNRNREIEARRLEREMLRERHRQREMER